jgi:hypothetical protein
MCTVGGSQATFVEVAERITLFGNPTRRDKDWLGRVFEIIELGEAVWRHEPDY